MSEFYKEKRTKNGVRNICKQCAKQLNRIRLLNPISLAHKREYEQIWKKNNKDKVIINKQKQALNYRSNPVNKQKLKARNIAIRKITNITKCQQCGCNHNLQRHHFDYEKPLNVSILCRNCHTEYHKTLKVA